MKDQGDNHEECHLPFGQDSQSLPDPHHWAVDHLPGLHQICHHCQHQTQEVIGRTTNSKLSVDWSHSHIGNPLEMVTLTCYNNIMSTYCVCS